MISTDVGGADVCSNDWKYGIKLNQNDSVGLTNVLADLVCGKLEVPEEYAIPFAEMSYSYRVKHVLLPKMGLKTDMYKL